MVTASKSAAITGLDGEFTNAISSPNIDKSFCSARVSKIYLANKITSGTYFLSQFLVVLLTVDRHVELEHCG